MISLVNNASIFSANMINGADYLIDGGYTIR